MTVDQVVKRKMTYYGTVITEVITNQITNIIRHKEMVNRGRVTQTTVIICNAVS